MNQSEQIRAEHVDAYPLAGQVQKSFRDVPSRGQTAACARKLSAGEVVKGNAIEPLNELLLSPRSDITVAIATPRKRRRGKCMSRRRGQNGHIVVSGKWYRVRFWI